MIARNDGVSLKAPNNTSSVEMLSLALFHEHRPESKFMVLSAYFDESGTHDTSDTIIMGGYIGNVHRWKTCENQLRRLFYEYGLSVFHAKSFRAGGGEVREWNREKRDKFVLKFDRIISKNLEFAIAAEMVREDYKCFYKTHVNKRSILHSEYGVCFRLCLGMMRNYVLNHPEKEPLYLILEGGHKNSGNAQEIFHSYKASLPDDQKAIFGTITFADKQSCPALSAADAYVYSLYRQRTVDTDYGSSDPLSASRLQQLPVNNPAPKFSLRVNQGILENLLKDPLFYPRQK